MFRVVEVLAYISAALLLTAQVTSVVTLASEHVI
jgi:hypothetical protein